MHFSTQRLRDRVVVFSLGIIALFVLPGWAATSSWNGISQIRERLTTVNVESFRLADHFQQEVLRLNDQMMLVQSQHDSNAWWNFTQKSGELDRWIDERKPELQTLREKEVLNQIDAAYTNYVAAAQTMAHNRLVRAERGEVALDDISKFELESERLLNLGFTLAGAHRESLGHFLARSDRASGCGG